MAKIAGSPAEPKFNHEGVVAALKELRHLLNDACAEHSQMTAVLVAAGKAHARVIEMQGTFDPDALNAGFNPPTGTSGHRREHRSGRPRILDTDAELRAVVLARINHMTYLQLADAVAETFPPVRRVGKSVIHAWNVQNRR